jgi:glyoxylase-like metal-dependent hydrolase (beta-lactamase superfamily II)
MFLEKLVTGVLDVNTYIIGCKETKEAAVIDPGGREAEILEILKAENLKLKYIINTHGHLDHSVGNSYLKDKTGVPIVIHAEDAIMLIIPQDPLLSLMLHEYTMIPADIELHNGDVINVGNIELQVIHTPGHTPGGMCLLTNGLIFTGDTLFAGGVGRTDLVGGSYKTLVQSIKDKLLVLDGRLKVLPGHGGDTTIKRERETNPFL